jgi:cyanophycinase-like exopeptidase
VQDLMEAGALRLEVLHTRDRAVADSDAFVAPLREARGVWFGGGRQWRLADAYLRTRTHAALDELLARGGVIGGTSAGATIQGSYLARGDTRGNETMMGDRFDLAKRVASRPSREHTPFPQVIPAPKRRPRPAAPSAPGRESGAPQRPRARAPRP